MPLYEYECGECSHRFEKIQRYSDQLVQECPSCGKGPVHKLLSAPAFQFKGTGWYVTDYPTKSRAGGESEGSKGDAKGESQSESKGESKGESKSESKGESKGDTKSDSLSSGSRSGPAAGAAPAGGSDATPAKT